MEQNKDHSGAAVRGEAVAESPCNLFIDEHGDWKVSEFDYQGSPVYFHPAPASARAVDAPYEPNEHAKFQAAYARINHSTPGGGWADLNGGTDDYCEPDVQAAWLLWKSRAADALDSQPTEPAMTNDALFRRAHQERDIEMTYKVASKICEFYPTETPRDLEKNHRLARAIQTIFASSQPTDGGVRNG